jgi:hypothetical protein
MQYEVTRDPYTNLPYFEGEETGLMCFTKVTINKITREMWLPVLNGKPFIADSSSGSSKYFSTLSFATLIILSNFSFSLFFSAKTFSSSVKKSLSFSGKSSPEYIFIPRYFEDPEDESAIKGFEGAKKWATENNIKEVLGQIRIYENAVNLLQNIYLFQAQTSPNFLPGNA